MHNQPDKVKAYEALMPHLAMSAQATADRRTWCDRFLDASGVSP
jgi:hypothetical protein